jgi:hypothetical protein
MRTATTMTAHLALVDSTRTKKMIKEEAEDMCVGSPRENRCIVIGDDKFCNKANNEILLRIQGAALRRFNKYKKRFHLTTAPL